MNTDTINKNKYGISEWSNYSLNFWNIPKCGATAVKAALFKKEITDPYAIHAEYHSTDSQKFISINDALSNGYLNFAVVRNPYDRAISMYKDFGLRRPIKKHKNQNLRDFDYFLDNVILRSKDETCNSHFRSMSSYIQPDGKLLVDKVFNFSNVGNFLKEYNLIFSPLNVTPHIDIKLTKEQKEKIHYRYKNDFSLIEYL